MLTGWALGSQFLKDWIGSGITQKANNALAVAACAGAMILLSIPPSAARLAATRALAALGALIGGLTLLEHITGVNLGIDTLLFHESPGVKGTVAAGRMGKSASIDLLLLGTSLFLLSFPGRAPRRLAAACASVAFCLPVVPLIGYIYHIEALFSVAEWTAIALQTALFLILLAAGALILCADDGPAGTLLRPGAGGVLARRLIPAALVLPPLLGYFATRLSREHAMSAELASALKALALMLTFTVISIVAARRVDRSEEAIQRHQDDLQAAGERLRRQNVELERFAAIASHDLKEPLRGIALSADFLVADEGPRVSAGGRQRLARISELCVRLANMIDGLMQYAKAGSTTGTQVVDLRLAAVRAVDKLRESIDAARARVVVDDRLPSVRGDPVLFERVFANLVENAIKYNRSESKLVEIRGEGGAVVVRDNGIGIDPRHHDAIFEIFRQIPGNPAPQAGAGRSPAAQRGVGLGLAMVKRIVEQHGGTVAVRSEPGRGTEFILEFEPDTRRSRSPG